MEIPRAAGADPNKPLMGEPMRARRLATAIHHAVAKYTTLFCQHDP
jgi:hypothetical protein